MPINIINLTKKYDDVIAVNNVNLTINDGELFSLLGVNGAGKTTLIKMLSTLTKPTSGEAFINELSINNQQDKNLLKMFHFLNDCKIHKNQIISA